MSLQSVRTFLAACAADIEIVEVQTSTATVALAAAAHGVEPAQIAKTLCRFFEVDHPATQADKRAILSGRPDLCANLTFVPVDFGKDDLADALLAADFDSSRPALVSWLGVTMYLEQRVTVGTLVTLRPILAPGSTLIFDAYPRSEEIAFDERPMFAAARALTATQGELMIGAFDSSAFAKAIAKKGWRITDVMKGDAMRRRWFGNQPQILWPPQSVLFYALEAV